MAAVKAMAVIPVFNERAHIGSLLDRFPKDVCDLVVVDDGSDDGTAAEIDRRGFKVVRHEKRRGVGSCIQDGIARAKSDGCDVIVVMAGNGKDDPTEIPNLLSAIETGADYVQGSRFIQGGDWKNLPWKRWLAIKLFTVLWSVAFFRPLTDVTNGFRAYRMSFLDDPRMNWRQSWLQTYEMEYYLHYYALHLGVRFKEIAVTKNYPTKVNYSKIRAGGDWIRIVKPLFLLRSGVRR